MGRLPPDVRKADVEEFFAPIKFTDCRIMGAFGFVEFGDARDADDAVRDGSKKTLMGSEIIVEKAKDNSRERPRAPPGYGGPGGYGDSYYGGGAPPARRGPAPGRGIRVLVKGLTPDISWQDLKDFGREGGAVIYADVNRSGEGVLEYQTIAEAETALERLNAVDIKGVKPIVNIDDPRGGGGGRDRGYDRDPYYRDRRSPPRSYGGDRDPRGDRRDYDRRDRDRSPRRDRSPPRRDYDRDRRSPPRDYRRGDDRDY